MTFNNNDHHSTSTAKGGPQGIKPYGTNQTSQSGYLRDILSSNRNKAKKLQLDENV